MGSKLYGKFCEILIIDDLKFYLKITNRITKFIFQLSYDLTECNLNFSLYLKYHLSSISNNLDKADGLASWKVQNKRLCLTVERRRVKIILFANYLAPGLVNLIQRNGQTTLIII